MLVQAKYYVASNDLKCQETQVKMAESEGFEPSKAVLPLYTLSRRAPSTDSASSPGAITR